MNEQYRNNQMPEINRSKMMHNTLKNSNYLNLNRRNIGKVQSTYKTSEFGRSGTESNAIPNLSRIPFKSTTSSNIIKNSNKIKNDDSDVSFRSDMSSSFVYENRINTNMMHRPVADEKLK